jgi:FtsZ-interacting cell division protein ZipA
MEPVPGHIIVNIIIIIIITIIIVITGQFPSRKTASDSFQRNDPEFMRSEDILSSYPKLSSSFVIII